MQLRGQVVPATLRSFVRPLHRGDERRQRRAVIGAQIERSYAGDTGCSDDATAQAGAIGQGLSIGVVFIGDDACVRVRESGCG